MWEVLIDWLTSQHILETNVFWCVKEEKGIRVIKHRLQPITFLANMFSFDFVQLSEECSAAAKISNMHSQYRLVGPVFGRFLPCGLAARAALWECLLPLSRPYLFWNRIILSKTPTLLLTTVHLFAHFNEFKGLFATNEGCLALV